MKEFDHIDELIRQKFEGFEPVPPESVWEKVKAGIGPDAPAPKGSRFTPPIITGLIVLVGLLSLLFLVTRMESTMPGAQAGSNELLPGSDRYTSFNASATQQPDAVQDATEINKIAQIPVRKPFEGNPDHTALVSENIPGDEASSSTSTRLKNNGTINDRFRENGKRMESRSSKLFAEGNGDESRMLVNRKARLYQTSDDYASPVEPRWSVGGYFNPEISINSPIGQPNSLNYAFQLLPRLNFGGWYLQSGLGVRLGSDQGDYVINYNKYLGSYEDVYEVMFDSTENGVIPIYYTEKVDVYDTVAHYSISETGIRYTYLDVPLLIGHEWEFNKFSITLHAGPSLSLLVDRSSPTADYPDERIRILSESPQIPARESINWQMMAGAGFSYKMGERFSFSLEPTFRYYLSGVYQDKDYNTRHPYSFGIRAGLIYNINH